MPQIFDAAVIGAGPNGLACAITLARAGRSVVVLEARDTAGGGCRTAELTLPGFRHDVCSAIHPLAAASPFFRSLDLAGHGVELVHPDIPLAHPLGGERAAVIERDGLATAAALGDDAGAWRALFAPLLAGMPGLIDDLLGPVRAPRHPLTLARFGLRGIRSAEAVARRFDGDAAPALLAGIAAHAMLPLTSAATAGVALLLGALAQSAGWPLVRGGSGVLADALVAELVRCGGEIRCGVEVRTFADIPPARAVFFDTTPAQMLTIGGHRLPALYRRRLQRFRRGPGVFKIDYALREPIPWLAPQCRRAGTVHAGGTMAEIAAAEAAVAAGRIAERPFCLVAQQSLFDDSRAPAGHHTAWVYCHVPNGSDADMTDAIEATIERFAPGFRDVVLARHTTSPRDFEAYNATYLGGDIGAGRQDLTHIFTRPVARISPYTTPHPHIFICSASTPPGAGVHGLCGYWAARAALRRILR